MVQPFKLTLLDMSVDVAMHCLHPRYAVEPSLKPPKAQLAGLSADIAAMVPKCTCGWLYTWKVYPLS